MPLPLTDDQLLETIDLMERNGNSRIAAHKESGIPMRTIGYRMAEARKRGLHLSSGAKEAMQSVSLRGDEVSGGWRHSYDENGKKLESVRWSALKSEIALDTVIERAEIAFRDIPAAPPIPEPVDTNDDLLTLYPLFDVHFGMHAWGDETGYQNYDIKLARHDINQAIGNVMALSPNSSHAILLIGGDFYHADGNDAVTPASKHHLDVDGRHFKVLDAGIEIIAATIDRLAAKHSGVTVRVLRGNHDEHSHMVLTLALAQRYRNHERIEIDKSPRDIFMHEWGKCLIAAHHGDKQKPERLAMILADICPFWSSSPYRIVFTGHRHHQQSNEFPGITWEQFRAFCPPDAYGAQFGPRRAMHSITFNKKSGISVRAQDPIVRNHE